MWRQKDFFGLDLFFISCVITPCCGREGWTRSVGVRSIFFPPWPSASNSNSCEGKISNSDLICGGEIEDEMFEKLRFLFFTHPNRLEMYFDICSRWQIFKPISSVRVLKSGPMVVGIPRTSNLWRFATYFFYWKRVRKSSTRSKWQKFLNQM